MVKRIKLMAEYGNTILWGVDDDDIGPFDLDDLPLSSDLKASLGEWAAAYDRTLNQDYPPDSAFASPEEESAFEAEGRRLWKALQAELGPEYQVVYYSDRQARLLDSLPDQPNQAPRLNGPASWVPEDQRPSGRPGG